MKSLALKIFAPVILSGETRISVFVAEAGAVATAPVVAWPAATVVVAPTLRTLAESAAGLVVPYGIFTAFAVSFVAGSCFDALTLLPSGHFVLSTDCVPSAF